MKLSPEALAEIEQRLPILNTETGGDVIPLRAAERDALVAHVREVEAMVYVPKILEDDEQITYADQCARLLREKTELRAAVGCINDMLDVLNERAVRLKKEAVEQFRQRAIEAVRAKGEEYRLQAERWHERAEQEAGAFQELSYADRDSCLSKAEAAFVYADLLRTLLAKVEDGEECRGNDTGFHTCGLPIGGCSKVKRGENG